MKNKERSLRALCNTDPSGHRSCNNMPRLYGCIVARTNERGLMLVFKNLSSGLWPSQIDEVIDLKPASTALMCRSIGALLDLFYCERQMNRLADGVHFNNCNGRDEYLLPGQTSCRVHQQDTLYHMSHSSWSNVKSVSCGEPPKRTGVSHSAKGGRQAVKRKRSILRN
jgi:hypothetical protein